MGFFLLIVGLKILVHFKKKSMNCFEDDVLSK